MKAAVADVGLLDAMAHPRLFQPFFSGPSWDTWRAVLAATFGEPLDEAALANFREVAERDPPKQRVKEAVYIVGRGGGKDSTASLIATHVAMTFNPSGRLRPGEKAVVMCIAVDRAQAGIVHGYIRGFFEIVPALKSMVTHMDDECIELSNGVVIEVHTNSYRAVRGRSIICAIFDEVAFWRSENSASPDVEVLGAVSPGLARMPGSMLILISSAHKRSGVLYQRWKDFYGRDDQDVLVVRGGTMAFNPTFDARIIEKELERDPQLYGAEYNCEWRDDLATFISRDLLDAAVDPGVTVRPPQAGTNYRAFLDPSGGISDSFTLAIAHAEGNRAVLDLLYERRAPFNPSEAVEQIAAVLRNYGLAQATGDRYAAAWVTEAFEKRGIKYLQSDRDRSSLYLDTLPLFTSGCARLIDNPRLIAQFAALERRTFSTGRERVDHGSSGHDDLCNSAAGALVTAATAAAPALWRRDNLLVDNAPVPLPSRASVLYVSAAVDATGTAFFYWATNNRYPGVAPLTLLDFDLAQPLHFDVVLIRLRELMTLIDAPSLGLYSTANLSYHSEAAGLPANAVGDKLLADRPGLSLAVAAEISRGRVKISATAWEKAQRQLLPFDFHLDAQPSAGTDAALIGIAVTLPQEALPRAA